MNPADSQMPNAPTQLYLLQMDSSINLSSNEQVLPLHILDNSLEFGRKQYVLPIPSKQREGQDHLQVLIDSSQGPAKIMGVILDNKYQNLQNLLPLPDSDVQLQTSLMTECTNTQPVPLKEEPRALKESQLNVSIKVEDMGVNDKVCELGSTQMMKNYVHISDRNAPPRAVAVLPTVLQIQRHHIISTRRTVPMRARFGPVQGIKRKISQSEAVELVLNATSNKKPLFLVKDMDDIITHIDTSDKDKSNWISLLPLGDHNSANVWLYEENQELYGITTENMPSRKALMLGYSKEYANAYGLIGPTKDVEKESPVQKSWWCYECQLALQSAKNLKNHMDLHHKEEKLLSRRRYRCRQCTRTFSRLFTLRRHTATHCPGRLEKRNNVASTELGQELTQINVNLSICSEDNRIPSDESFQNYSNGLDFSTSLFDTDRISNLDISGNSRSDNDFNPYVSGYKDENGLTNDLDFSRKIENSSKEERPKPVDEFPAPCPHCNQTVVKGKRRQHVSKCSARLLKCECKKVFTNIKQFTDHIWTQHSNEKPSQNVTNDTDGSSPAVNTNPQNPAQYKCEQCQHTFKRRGMLVNHLWRIHNTVSTRVPLERRMRHYPCGTCPKIYRTAAKRDRHVQQHHPGAAKVRGQALEGGTRVCEPAMCSACPRQYATRAKLLQHQRAHHPNLVPPPTKKNNTKKKFRNTVS